MAEAVLLAISKISTALGDEATRAVIAKLSGNVSNLRELPDKVEYIRRELRLMKDVIQDLDSTNTNMNFVKGWIDELRKLAYRVEDIMDKYSYYACQRQQEGSVMRCVRGAHYAGVFSEVASEVMKIKGDVEQVKRQQMDLQFSSFQEHPLTSKHRDLKEEESCLNVAILWGLNTTGKGCLNYCTLKNQATK